MMYAYLLKNKGSYIMFMQRKEKKKMERKKERKKCHSTNISTKHEY
jgi:hypothetical protein